VKKTLLAMAEGRIEYIDDEIIVSENRLELICRKDEIINGKFYIESSLHKDIKGILYSSNYRMKCEQVQFSGKKIEIAYSFDSKGLIDKQTIKGDIYIETNIGEYNLPFVVTVLNETVESSLGSVRNLFHFVNLAHSDYDEAYKLFVSKKFKLLKMDLAERMQYEMLSKNNICKQHMEEFLLAINKKKQVLVNIPDTVIKEKYTGRNFSKTISIMKNSWGFFEMKVSSDADFINLEKTKILSDDFVGNNLDYSFVVEGSKLHKGNNYAKITFVSFNQQIDVTVEVDVQNDDKNLEKLEIKKIKADLCQLYIQVRTHTIHNAVWIRESRSLLEKWMSLVPDNKILWLFHAQLLILDKKKDDARFILDKFRKERFIKRQQPELYAYLLYVEALFKQQEEFTKQVVIEIRMLVEMHPHSTMIFLALLFLDDEINSNNVRKYQMIHEQFVYGCRSPLLYLEAFLLLKQDVTLLGNIQSFEKQVLSFALHQGIITEDISVAAAKAAREYKSYDVLLCRLMQSFYRLFERIECLEVVCGQLIKGGIRDCDCFEWYEKGVNAGLKLNLLYEHYIFTVPMDRKDILPKELLMYFSYNYSMDYRNKAYIYANVIRNKEELFELYEKYEPYISQFVQEQVLMRHVDENLIYLYENHMDILLENKECCDVLEEIIFTHVISCKKEGIRRVIVAYSELSKQEEFPVIDNKAYVRIYTDAAFIALEDLEGKLHFETVDFSIKTLLMRTKLNRFINHLNKKKTGVLLNRYKRLGTVLEKDGVEICQRLLKKDIITSEFREELIERIISYFEEKRDEEVICNYIQKIDFSLLDEKRRGEIFEKMILLGMYDEVYDLIFEYGYENVNPKRLVRLCSRKISSGLDEDRLVELCGSVFSQRKYDEVMLEYLVSEFYGSTYQMIAIWKSAKNFDIDTSKICERLLIQMLYTNFMPGKAFEIFKDYCKCFPKTEIIMAYMSCLSYEYVVNEQVVEAEFFDYILKMWKKEEKLNDCCILAYLKYCVEKKTVSEQEKKFINYALNLFDKKEIKLRLLENAAKLAEVNNSFCEKTWIEYLGNPKNKVTVCYRILDESTEDCEFIREELKPAFGPVFSKDVTLFYGETLQYYIIEENIHNSQSSFCSGIISREHEDFDNVAGRYGLLNDMYISRMVEDEKSLVTLMNKYKKYEVITMKLFNLKE